MSTGSLPHNRSGDDEGKGGLPVTSELIGTIQNAPGVLKSSQVALIKRLAKLAPDVDIHVQVRGGRVRIGHTLCDYTDPLFGAEQAL